MSNGVQSILRAEIQSGHDWFFIGTLSGISIFDAKDSTFVSIDVLETMPHSISAMLYDPNKQRLYVGTSTGLYAYSLTSSSAVAVEGFPLTTEDGLESNNILAIALDGSQLYLGTGRGLHKYDLDRMDQIGLHVLDSSSGMPEDAVAAIAIDKSSSKGTLYAGTIGGGVAVIKISYDVPLFGQEWWALNGSWAYPVIAVICAVVFGAIGCYVKSRK